MKKTVITLSALAMGMALTSTASAASHQTAAEFDNWGPTSRQEQPVAKKGSSKKPKAPKKGKA